MTDIKIFERNASGTFECSEINWKNSTNSADQYYFYPVRRPVPHLKKDGEFDYETTSDISVSYSKVNFFQITGTSTIKEPQIIVCSPVKTAIEMHFEHRLGTDGKPDPWAPGIPVIDYNGSGWADGVSFDSKVGVKVTLDSQRNDSSYEAFTDFFKDLLPDVKDELLSIYYSRDSKTQAELETQIEAFRSSMSKSLVEDVVSQAEIFKGKAVELLDKKSLILLDHLFLTPSVCAEINIMTGSAEKIRYVDIAAESLPEIGQPYTPIKSSGDKPDTEIELDLIAKKTYLFAGVSNSFIAPTNSVNHNLRFVSTGNMVFDVALGNTPETATNIQTEYTGATLHTPYFISQIRAAASEYTDVGNSPEYRIVFKCKIYN